ncbi:MAG: hypothetical protein J2P17_28000 [Mycobacterium sp.]|nr:hypothetical protein [Mycobacterium sp.]
MAYVSARVRTTGGDGEMHLAWHNAEVEVWNRDPDAKLGAIGIHWGKVSDNSGMVAYLDPEEAQDLIDRLNTALTEVAGVTDAGTPVAVDDGDGNSREVA